LTEPTTGPIKNREEVVEAIEGLLKGWRVPENVPQEISTAVVPSGEDAVSARLIAKGIHTLVLRVRPRCIILIGASPRQMKGVALSAFGEISSTAGDVSIDERIASRLATLWLPTIEVADSHEEFDSLPLHRIGALMTRALAPGCRVVPVSVPLEANDDFDPIALGTLLGEALSEERGTIVVAGAEIGAGASGFKGDARVLRHLIDIDPFSLQTEARAIGCSSSAPLSLAAAHALGRGEQIGSLLEHAVIGNKESGIGAVSVVL